MNILSSVFHYCIFFVITVHGAPEDIQIEKELIEIVKANIPRYKAPMDIQNKTGIKLFVYSIKIP